MSAETTPAIERMARQIAGLDPDEEWPTSLGYAGPDRFRSDMEGDARDWLAAALDVEEMARVAYAEGAWCGLCEYDGWDSCADCRSTLIGYATAIRTAILGADS